MVKLKNNEIENRLAEEDITEVKNAKEVGDDVSAEEFSIENYSDGSYQTVFGEELKKGMSYSPKMLDINELFENGVVKRRDRIDLADIPEVETIQAATQEQLNMLTPESREQITVIHLSNNTPVGWDDNFDYSNRCLMDRELDLTNFENVTEVQTHFYVNDELENIKLPEGVNEVLCRYSKMKNLSNNGDLKYVNVILERAETAFDCDDGYVYEEAESEESEWEEVEQSIQEYLKTGDAKDLKAFEESFYSQDVKEDWLLEEAIAYGKLDRVKYVVENIILSTSSNFRDRTLARAIRCVTRNNGSFRENPIPRETSEQLSERREIVKYLISQGADIEIDMSGYQSPLIEAIGEYHNSSKDYECIDILVKAGASITSKAVECAMYDSAAFDVLVKNGYVSTVDDLRVCIEETDRNHFVKGIQDRLKIMETIIQQNPNALKELDASSIMSHIKTPDVGLFLMQYGVDMTYAAESPAALENLGYMKVVVENGADITDGKVLRQAIHLRKDKEMLKFLMEKGSDVNNIKVRIRFDSFRKDWGKDYKENIAMTYIREALVLKSLGCSFDPEVFQMLVKKGADLSYVAETLYTGSGSKLTMLDTCLYPDGELYTGKRYALYGDPDFISNKYEDGSTLISIASSEQMDILGQVLDAGAKVYERDLRHIVYELYNLGNYEFYRSIGDNPQEIVTSDNTSSRLKLEEGHQWKDTHPQWREILDTIVLHGPEDIKDRCRELVKPFNNQEIMQDLEANFERIEAQKENSISKVQKARIAEKQGKVQEWKQHRNEDLLKSVKEKVSAGNEAEETEKSHNKPKVKVTQNVKPSKSIERE